MISNPIKVFVTGRKMNYVFIDYESYYDQNYSLDKMPIDNYVLDERFLIHGVAIKINQEPTEWLTGDDVRVHLNSIQFWSESIVISHNNYFDGFISSQIFGVKPKQWLCTMCMGRGLFGPNVLNNLDSLSVRLGGRGKTDRVEFTKGKRTLTSDEMKRLANYSIADNEECAASFYKMLKMFPKPELDLIDLTLRMFLEPRLELDIPLLEQFNKEEIERKQEALRSVEWVYPYIAPEQISFFEVDKTQKIKDVLMSDPQFEALLKKLGIKVPQKTSKKTGEKTTAFSKADAGFKRMLKSEDERTNQLANARLAVKSTMGETRSQSFLEVGDRPLPVQLLYFGNHTGRWCLKGESEVLTKSGWIRLDKWKEEPIVQFDPESYYLTWCNYPIKNEFSFNGEMIVYNSPYHKSSYTPEHIIPTLTCRDNMRLFPATKGLSLRFDLPMSGYILQEDYPISDVILKLTIAIQADGCMIDDPQRCGLLFAFKKERKISRLENLLNQANIPFKKVYDQKYTRTRFSVKRKDIPEQLKSAKLFGEWFYLLSERQLGIVIDEVAKWDSRITSSGSPTYVSTVYNNAEKIATVSHLIGRSSTIKRVKGKGNRKDTFEVTIKRSSKTRSNPKHVSKEIFSGNVYCPTTDTGFFLCRTNGLIVVTGNSGQGGRNLQNLQKGSDLRKSIYAPKGYIFGKADSSQVECRLTSYIASLLSGTECLLLKWFRDGLDPYCEFGTMFYGEIITKADENRRFVSKQAVLGLGFQMWIEKFQWQMKALADMDLDIEFCTHIVKFYREIFPEIKQMWYTMQDMLDVIMNGGYKDFGFFGFDKEGIRLPSGLHVHYADLRCQEVEKFGKMRKQYDYYGYEQGKKQRVNLFGGKVAENLIQALDRQIVAEQMLVIKERYPIVLQEHDGIVALIPEAEAEEGIKWIVKVMSTPPKWAKDFPVAAEGKVSERYG